MAAEVEPRFLLSEISDLPNLKRLSFTDDLLDTDGHPGFRRESRLFARTTVPILLQPPPGRPPQLPYISQWRYSTGIGTPERSVDVSATAPDSGGTPNRWMGSRMAANNSRGTPRLPPSESHVLGVPDHGPGPPRLGSGNSGNHNRPGNAPAEPASARTATPAAWGWRRRGTRRKAASGPSRRARKRMRGSRRSIGSNHQD